MARTETRVIVCYQRYLYMHSLVLFVKAFGLMNILYFDASPCLLQLFGVVLFCLAPVLNALKINLSTLQEFTSSSGWQEPSIVPELLTICQILPQHFIRLILLHCVAV